MGLVKKSKEAYTTPLDLIGHLKSGKLEKVDPKRPDQFVYTNRNGQELIVNGTVHNLVNNITVQNFIFQAVAAPLQRPRVEGLSTSFPKPKPRPFKPTAHHYRRLHELK